MPGYEIHSSLYTKPVKEVKVYTVCPWAIFDDKENETKRYSFNCLIPPPLTLTWKDSEPE